MGRFGKRKYRCVTSKKHKRKWWTHMTKKERQQIRDSKGYTKKLDQIADKYADIALGIKTPDKKGFDMTKKEKKTKELRIRKVITKDWERLWCPLCKHPNPKTLLFCQLCDSSLKPLSND